MALFLIVAPSGAGKTTLAERLARANVWTECISTTTRPMRVGEVDGKTYYFVDKEEFKEIHSNGGFAEMVTYDEHHYGISHDEIERVTKLVNHVYIIVEYNGYKQVKELYPNAIGIFLHMTKEDCLANMLLRGDSMEKALKRINTYDNEMKNRVHFDYVVKNVRHKEIEAITILQYIVKQYS